MSQILLCDVEGCNRPMMPSLFEAMSTTVGFFSPPGHNHDDNCVSMNYHCSAGHNKTVSKRNKCDAPGCDWVGLADCNICHSGPKFAEWPDTPMHFFVD